MVKLVKNESGQDFIWLLINEKAKEVFNSGLFQVFELHSGTESLIETSDDLDEALSNGNDIAIEVGYLK